MQSLCLLFDTMTMGSNIEAVLKQKPSTVWKKEINNQVKSSSFDVSLHFRTQWLRSMLNDTCSEVYMYIHTYAHRFVVEVCSNYMYIYIYIHTRNMEFWIWCSQFHTYVYNLKIYKYIYIYTHVYEYLY